MKLAALAKRAEDITFLGKAFPFSQWPSRQPYILMRPSRQTIKGGCLEFKERFFYAPPSKKADYYSRWIYLWPCVYHAHKLIDRCIEGAGSKIIRRHQEFLFTQHVCGKYCECVAFYYDEKEPLHQDLMSIRPKCRNLSNWRGGMKEYIETGIILSDGTFHVTPCYGVTFLVDGRFYYCMTQFVELV